MAPAHPSRRSRTTAVEAATNEPAVAPPTVVLAEGRDTLCRLLDHPPSPARYRLQVASSAQQALALVAKLQPSLVITDLAVDDGDGRSLFEHLHAGDPTLPIIVFTRSGTIDGAIDAIQRGAFSYLTSPFNAAKVLHHVDHALRLSAGAANGCAGTMPAWCQSIITRDPAMRALLAQAGRASAFDVSVLIQGESGTGKELLAQAIHRASPRAALPFVALNCSAIPAELLESELFGHARGAFTGAARDHKGLFQAAQGGTLSLDEIGDMPLPFQAKLLRAIQEKQVRPVGATRSVVIDVRLVAATHHRLREEITDGRFREDLYYRLNVIPLEIPPLRCRRQDIPLLASHFLRQFWSDQRVEGHKRLSFSALEALAAQNWPGNVRQLCNAVEQAAVLSPGPVIAASMVCNALQGSEDGTPPLTEMRRRTEERYLIQLLEITGGNVTHAARLAHCNRTELYKLLKHHRIEPQRYRSGVAARPASIERVDAGVPGALPAAAAS